MTTQSFLQRITASTLFALLATTANARIHENKVQVEARFLGNPNTVALPRDLTNSLISNRSIPYASVLSFFPESTEHVIYHRDLDAQPDPTNVEASARRGQFPIGWNIHVAYLRNQPILINYRRDGGTLTDEHVELILAANARGQEWLRDPDALSQPSKIGYNFALADGSVRARQAGNSLIIFLGRLDEALFAQMKIRATEETTGF